MKVPTLLLALALSVTALAGCTTPGILGGDDETGGGDPNAPLKPVFTAAPDASDPMTIHFDARASDGSPTEYRWDFGDGQAGAGSTISHTYEHTNGAYQVTLTVVGADKTVSDRQFVTLGSLANEAPVAAFTINSQWLKTTDSFVVDASNSSDADNDPLTYTWSYSPMVPAGGGHDHGGGDAGAMPTIPPASTTLGSLNSGALAKDQSWEVTLTEAGVYLMHCHPHPTMKQNVTVSGDATLEGTVYVDIYDAYFAPENIAVKPGTKVVYTNHGEVVHTATQEGFRTVAATGKTASFTIPTAGAFDVILTVKDAKGTTRESKIPVISAESLPDGTFKDQKTGTFTVATGDSAKQAFPFTLKYNVTDLQVTLTYDSPGGVNKLHLALYKGDVNGEPLFRGDPAGGASQTLQTGALEAGSYVAYVTGETGVNVAFTVDMLATYILVPRAEDFAMAMPSGGGEGGDGHGDHGGH